MIGPMVNLMERLMRSRRADKILMKELMESWLHRKD
jgi:hypothetical protein